MNLYSTNDRSRIVSLREAVLQSLPPDGGLYMPTVIPSLPSAFFSEMAKMSFAELSSEVARVLLQGSVDPSNLSNIIYAAVDFAAPVVMHDEQVGTLELWHGPSMAFKDFGARFMAQLMGYYLRGEDQKTTVLVATSGDTGGAVGAGFHGVEGIEVVILYPKGKVSDVQERQLTTLGNNVTALEIEGTFDDCQHLVKTAFLDLDLEHRYQLSSANSINIARLIPQTFYYFEMVRQLLDDDRAVVTAVPSGNFGNLTAGVLAQRLGLPIHRFVAATNSNDVVPKYLQSGTYTPVQSVQTISNAMDVGSPSNFVRLLELHGSTWNSMTDNISGFVADDEQTRQYMRQVYHRHDYICDPHGAIAYGALQGSLAIDEVGIYLETAHPAKFKDVVDDALEIDSAVPARLADLTHLPSFKEVLGKSYEEFKSWLLDRPR